MNSTGFTETFGWDYLPKKLAEYMGTPAFIFAYVILVLIMLVLKNKEWKEIFVYPFILQILTVFNPILLHFLIPKLRLNSRYYRFFWILPAALVMGFFCVWILSKIRYRILKCIVLALALGSICYAGFPHRIYYRDEEPLEWPFVLEKENEYKVPDFVIELDEIIHSEGKENPLVVYGYREQHFMRQYDGKVRSVFKRNDTHVLPSYIPEEVQEIMVSDDYKEILRLLVIFGNQPDGEKFAEALDALDVDYIILDNNVNGNADYAKNLGYECIGNADSRYVFKVK